MSKDFLERLARGELTNTRDYRRMKDALSETKKEDEIKSSDVQEWQNWELSPVWSSSDPKQKKVVEEGIRADSVQRALDQLDKGQ